MNGWARSRSSIKNADDFSADMLSFDCQLSHAHRQLEPSWPSTAGVEVKHSVTRFLLRGVAVAGDDDTKSRSLGFQIKLGEVMQDVDGNSGKLDDLSFRKLACPRILIDVAANRGQRSDAPQVFEDLRISDVASMDDVLGAA